MTPETIIMLIEAAAKLLAAGVDAYEKVQADFSETDTAKIRAALADAQVKTAAYRPLVDSALDAAEQKA